MFRSAALKLTVWYLAVIMTLSIGCSLALYRVSSNELARSANRPVDIYNLIFGPESAGNVNDLRTQQLEKDKSHLKSNLLLFNVGVLLAGGAISYFFARRTLAPLEESLEMQKRFTGDASHELRTPLAAMQAEIEVSLRDANLSKQEAIDLLKSNLEEVGKLKNLSEGLLSLATTVDKDSVREQVSLANVTSEALQQMSKRAKQRRIKIISSSKQVNVYGNRQQLLNLLGILLDNAIKYSNGGSEVRINNRVRDKHALISVIDHGKGMSEQDIPHIFDRFYRADSSRTKGDIQGYGLGLAIAKKIVELHKGTIEVKSTLGKGSTFTVRLPLA